MKILMNVLIKWNTLSTEDWEKRFSQLPRSNILQSYTYARAACPLLKQKAKWGLIFVDDREAGLVQIFEAGILWNAFHALIVDRGPLWFEGFGGPMHIKLFYGELNRQFPQRFGRRRRVLPETEDGLAAQKMIAGTGLVPANDAGYQTIWLDLTKDEETLRAGLKQKWRNSLNKAERMATGIEWDLDAKTLSEILTVYATDKEARGYGGPTPALLRAYAPLIAARGELLVGRTLENGKLTAFTVFATHGRSATYLIGWSSSAGREASAHHRLLWEGALMLQRKGIKELDLGGINDEGAEGIKNFKEGLGGKNVRYLGRHT
jgi:hypothetical protein